MTMRSQVIGWMLIATATVVIRTRTHKLSVGLVTAYLVNLWLIHWPAALSYLLPWSSDIELNETRDGFMQSFYGVIGFAVGALIVGPLVLRAVQPPRSDSESAARRRPNATLPYVYIGIGLAGYFVIGPLLSGIPTVTAIAGGLRQLMVVGLCLLLWHAWYAKQKRRFVAALVFTALLPLMTILREGFLSYGAMALICVIAFLASFFRPRYLLAALLMVVLYVGFSFYVTYMRDRGDIRASVWGGQRASARVDQLRTTLRGIEWFDPTDSDHWQRVNGRLNQNTLVGRAVENLDDKSVDFARGKTIVDGVLSLVPRAIWPQKPQSAGSGDIVSRYTGITFARGTSVGVGQVMEFYINFGIIGVIIGFLLMGTVITILDTWAAQRIWAGDWLQFAVWYLPGVALMQVGGSLVDVFSSGGAAIVAILVVNRYVVPLQIGPPTGHVQHAAL